MDVIILGSAAGGGFPQWNCWCASCRVARESPQRARPRTQSSIAISANGVRWFLCNASPDVRTQLGAIPSSSGSPRGIRATPIDGVVLTDAELDHTLGLLLLREARHLSLYATPAVESILEHGSHILPTLRAFANVDVVHLPDAAESSVPLTLVDRTGHLSGLTVETFPVGGDSPRFARGAPEGHTVGLLIRHTQTGTALAFVPGVGELNDGLLRHLEAADVILFDGTCYTDDELITSGISSTTARAMGHVPIAGDGGSLAWLRALAPRRCVYTHINNTNPILIEDSPERRMIDRAGVVVGYDGMRLTVRGARGT